MNANNKPAAIVAIESRNDRAIERRRKDDETRRAASRQRIARYNAVTFWRGSFELSECFKEGRRRGGFDWETLNDAQNDMRDRCDHSYFFEHGCSREIENESLDDALALFRFMRPNAPAHLYREAIARDLVRAYASAAADDYSLQFFDYCRDAIESAADAVGLPWVWLDSSGNPTTEDYDAHAVGFACSRRAYLDKAAAWWPAWWHDKTRSDWDNYDNNRERIEAADDVMRERVAEILQENAGDLEGFDERGNRAGDTDWWPALFQDYSEAAQEFDDDNAKMRARLRDMIRTRAPLEKRAELVATVYGVPGTPRDDSEE